MTKNALITGASRGLGLALARTLAAAGWHLVLTARGADALERAAAELGATAIPGDVTDPAHVRRLADAVPELDLLVNNASDLGVTPLPPLAGYPLDAFRVLLETNVTAPLALIQATLPALRARRGAVVNITSDAATGAYEGWGGYGATKAALEQLSNVLAAEEPELAVWWTDPGEMNTRMLADAVGAEEAATAADPAQVAAILHDVIRSRPAGGRIALQDLAEAQPPSHNPAGTPAPPHHLGHPAGDDSTHPDDAAPPATVAGTASTRRTDTALPDGRTPAHPAEGRGSLR